MSSDALLLREVSLGTWRAFADRVHEQARPDALGVSSARAGSSSCELDAAPLELAAALQAADARAPVLSHWHRALSLGASLEGPPAEEQLLRGEALKEQVERTELVLQLAAADLQRAASDVSPREYVLLLAGASGVVVNALGGGRFADEARRVLLIPGASWSEAARGTNAIGTAIAERRPVYVRGSAHLGRRFHDLVCYAAPIFDADGSLLAVLDATSALSYADDAIGAAVVRSAGAIMAVLRDRAFGQAGAAIRQTLARALERMDGIALLLEPPARVARMNAGAQTLFGLRREQTAEMLLGVDMATLAREGHEPRGLMVELGGRRYGVRVDPIQTFDGRQIALLVFLEPSRMTPNAAPRATPPCAAFAPVFSRDAELDRALAFAQRIADSALPVLLLAETGAGKELVARAIHEASGRASEPFVAVNCGAISPALLESELFGYAPGAFTGAERSGRQGLFATASGGTIFLDEVAEMPPPMQAALLRVLEDGTYRRVGESTPRHANVRIVSATCRDLKTMVEAGTFRRDLFYRLEGVEVVLPPLRARADRSALAAHLLSMLAHKRKVLPAPRLSADVLAAIERYTWPGNVRELHTLLDVSLILAAGNPSIELEHLPPEFHRVMHESAHAMSAGAGHPASAVSAGTVELAALEASAVRRVLSDVGGNVSRAARQLGVARSTLYRMMRRHDL